MKAIGGLFHQLLINNDDNFKNILKNIIKGSQIGRKSSEPLESD